ncbi:MAG: aldo/keto reductase [Clostridia bacterium]|nr:aldo/keto reductase [Clostridia bacterium]
MPYNANESRYEKMIYNRVGKSGLKLPAVSLGMWQNFGDRAVFDDVRTMMLAAFDLGMTHFDLANNYGPTPGSAEETFGRVYEKDLKPYRDEIIVSSKAGYYMWPGPYGEWGSKKNLIASCDQSLKRTGLEYFDIFYHHRPDPETPLEETMDALAQLVRQGKALYVGISNYNAADTEKAYAILKDMGVRLLIHQASYNMFNRRNEEVFAACDRLGIGAALFSPLAQGLLTDKYLNGIPADSRAAGPSVFLHRENITPDKVEKARRLNEIASSRGQTLAQMALSWDLRHACAATVLLGVSRLSQIQDSVKAIDNLTFTQDELDAIDGILSMTF